MCVGTGFGEEGKGRTDGGFWFGFLWYRDPFFWGCCVCLTRLGSLPRLHCRFPSVDRRDEELPAYFGFTQRLKGFSSPVLVLCRREPASCCPPVTLTSPWLDCLFSP